MELLHIGKRVKFASYTIYSSCNEVLGTVSIWSLELQFHIPYQSGARIRAKITTSCDMATPHAPIATLQSHLQALYNNIILTFVIAISLFSGGRSCAGVAIILLRLVREVGKDIGSVDRREGVGQGGGSIATPK
jgi:hypothetical protein